MNDEPVSTDAPEWQQSLRDVVPPLDDEKPQFPIRRDGTGPLIGWIVVDEVLPERGAHSFIAHIEPLDEYRDLFAPVTDEEMREEFPWW